MYVHVRCREFAGAGQLFVTNDEDDGTSLETTYHLMFPSSAERELFELDILAAHGRTMTTVDEEQGLEDIEAITSNKKARGRSRSRASSKTAQTSMALHEGIKRTATRSTLGATDGASSHLRGAGLLRAATSVVMMRSNKPGGMLHTNSMVIPSTSGTNTPATLSRENSFVGTVDTPRGSFVASSGLAAAEKAAAALAPLPHHAARTRRGTRTPSPARALPSFFGSQPLPQPASSVGSASAPVVDLFASPKPDLFGPPK